MVLAEAASPSPAPSGFAACVVRSRKPHRGLRRRRQASAGRGATRRCRQHRGSVLPTYDAASNPRDQQNRLVRAVIGTKESIYDYDGESKRVRIRELTSGTTTKDESFVWCGSRICQKRSGTGTVLRNYFEQGFEEGTSDFFYTRDHLGSVREVVASNGTTVASRMAYSPWGEITETGSGASSDFGFTGHHRDRATGLGLTWFRAYDPRHGRWSSADPLGLTAGANLRRYVHNAPVDRVDPTGLWDDTDAERREFCNDREFHRRRNQHNRCPKKRSSCENDSRWDYDRWAKKYRGINGDECAYDADGNLLPDERANYTYNYSPYPFGGFGAFLMHLAADVYAHVVCGGDHGYDPGLTTEY